MTKILPSSHGQLPNTTYCWELQWKKKWIYHLPCFNDTKLVSVTLSFSYTSYIEDTLWNHGVSVKFAALHVDWHLILTFPSGQSMVFCPYEARYGHVTCCCQWNWKRENIWVEALKSWVCFSVLSFLRFGSHRGTCWRGDAITLKQSGMPSQHMEDSCLESILDWWWTLNKSLNFCC